MKTYKEFSLYISENWTEKRKRSIDCNNPKGFSEKAHCAGRKKKLKEDTTTKILVVFDIDDTLVHTSTKVRVLKDRKVVKELNSHEFTNYKLKEGEEFDFQNFRNAKEFFDNAKPILPMMDQLKKDIQQGNKVAMVTARADFDDKELFLDTFRKYKIDMNKVHVYRAGNMKGGSIEENKKKIIRSLMDKDTYGKVIMYDDSKANLNSFVSLKKDYPKSKFYGWFVNPAGEASEHLRESISLRDTSTQDKPFESL